MARKERTQPYGEQLGEDTGSCQLITSLMMKFTSDVKPPVTDI